MEVGDKTPWLEHSHFTPGPELVASVASVGGGSVAHRGLGLGGNGSLPSSAGIRWLLTHIARSCGLGSGRRAPGEDPSSPYPRQYASASQGSVGGCRPSACPRWCPGYRLPRQSPPPLGSASVLYRNPQPASLCRVPPFPRHPPPPYEAFPPPSLGRIRQEAGLQLGAAAPSGRPPDSAGLRTAGGSDDTACRVLPLTRLGCTSF